MSQDRLWKRMAAGSVFFWCFGIVVLSEHWWGHAPFWVADMFFALAFLDSIWSWHTYKHHKDWE